MGFVTRFVPVGGLVSLARSFVRSSNAGEMAVQKCRSEIAISFG